jgi:antitoxin component YwqK of YwqJK toxin-antitoxin module
VSKPPAQGLSLDDLVKREGLYYENSTDEPFTGKVDEGLARGAIKNGKQEGPWVQYHDDGQIYWKGAYKNGKREGPWVGYWDNGRVLFKGAWKNGKREGPWVHYDVHGTKVRDRSGTYRNGEKVSD